MTRALGHSSSDPSPAALLDPNSLSSAQEHWREIDRCAIWALEMELQLYPKAGLVSFVDNGSHDDMDANTFMRSIAALKGYFRIMAQAGAEGAQFFELKALGMNVEAQMFHATDGINTHRGAVFSLGLLAAAAGRRHGANVDGDALANATGICRAVADWGSDINAARPTVDISHGAKVRARYGVTGAREQAASGFPILHEHILPMFAAAYQESGCLTKAGLQAFYATITVLEDNNLLYRAGTEGLAYAQNSARAFLAGGGMMAADGHQRARDMHAEFVARRLSPGGAADMIAAVFFLAAVTGLIPQQVLPWR